MTGKTDELVRRFLAGELDPEQEATALHHIADDEEARQLLHFDRSLRERLGADGPRRVPHDFVSRTMEAIAAEEEAGSVSRQASPAGGLRQLWDRLIRPRTVVMRPAYGLAAVVLLGLLALWPAVQEDLPGSPDASSTEQLASAESESSAAELVGVRFVYVAEQASSVAVAGDFSDWEPVPLEPRTVAGERIWTSVVPLPSGEHQYMFVVDGEKWVTDPLAPVQREDGFGNRNAVINI
jgi:hypothetical protein